ncbi:ATP-binding protein [Nocardioides albertanoniae]|uniref:ATP-binding protein n=1 Tax=Nocardioides albertanoniae TaxID=1175486 RepID=UPI001476DF4B|nr:ATP-binding protein [Nocardioides albertanoniae]
MSPQEDDEAWPEIMEQFGLQMISLAEQMRISLDGLEADEDDPDRLRKLYEVDHAVTRMRRASRDLRTLAGRSEEEMGGTDTSLLDIIRIGLSSIERYNQVTIGRVSDLAVIGYAADDVACLVAALLDNATKYSPGKVTVNVHLADAGSVLFRIEDTGIGIPERSVGRLNALLAGPIVELVSKSGSHTGFPVVHRIARKYDIDVRLATRPAPGNGMIAMVTVPAQLLCELPVAPVERAEAPRQSASTGAGSISVLPAQRHRGPQQTSQEAPQQAPRPRPLQRPQPGLQGDPQTGSQRALPMRQPLPDSGQPLPDSSTGAATGAAPEPSPEPSRESHQSPASRPMRLPSAQLAPPPVQQPSPDISADTMKTPLPVPDEAGETDGTSAPAEPDGQVESGALPRREPVSLRDGGSLREPAEAPQTPEASPEDQSSARHSFADDLDAFSIGR